MLDIRSAFLSPFPQNHCDQSADQSYLQDSVLSVAVSHDGQWVVSRSNDRGVQIWDAKTAVPQCMLRGHKNSVISVDLSSSDNLATGSVDGEARICKSWLISHLPPSSYSFLLLTLVLREVSLNLKYSPLSCEVSISTQ